MKTTSLATLSPLVPALAAVLATVVVACTTTSTAPAPGLGDAGTGPDSDAASEGEDAGSEGDAAADGGALDARGYGEPCTVGDDATCAPGLLCLEGPSGSTVGFCTKTCPKTSSGACSGTPPGTAAFCVVTDVNASGDKGCAFVCGAASKTFTCPGELKCQTTDEPPGSGQYLCLP